MHITVFDESAAGRRFGRGWLGKRLAWSGLAAGVRWFAAVVCAGLLTASAHAQTKVAFIDLQKVFDNYWKTKQASANIKVEASDVEKELKGKVDDFKKAKDAYKKLLDSAADPAISNDERDKRKKDSEAKLVDLKAMEQELQQFDQQAKSSLSAKRQRMRDGIVAEIRDRINTKARSSAFNLVLDSTGISSSTQSPIVLFSGGSVDITDEILGQLNLSAPANLPGAADTTPKPGDKKDDSKKSK